MALLAMERKQYLVKMPVSEETWTLSYTMLNAHPYLELLQIHSTLFNITMWCYKLSLAKRTAPCMKNLLTSAKIFRCYPASKVNSIW